MMGITIFLVGFFYSNYYYDYIFNMFNLFILSIIAGISIGFLSYNDECENIIIGESKEYTTLLLKIYDNSGYRNFNKQEILTIIENLEDINKESKEVSESIGGQKF
jgi:hypothetical protein